MHAHEQLGLFPDSCCRCGHTRGPDEGPPWVWRCAICERPVCSNCVVCKAYPVARLGREIFHVTYCSPGCREANRAASKLAPRQSLYDDDELDELADYQVTDRPR